MLTSPTAVILISFIALVSGAASIHAAAGLTQMVRARVRRPFSK